MSGFMSTRLSSTAVSATDVQVLSRGNQIQKVVQAPVSLAELVFFQVVDGGRVQQVAQLERFVGSEEELQHAHAVRAVLQVELVQLGREGFELVLFEPAVEQNLLLLENALRVQLSLRSLEAWRQQAPGPTFLVDAVSAVILEEFFSTENEDFPLVFADVAHGHAAEAEPRVEVFAGDHHVSEELLQLRHQKHLLSAAQAPLVLLQLQNHELVAVLVQKAAHVAQVVKEAPTLG